MCMSLLVVPEVCLSLLDKPPDTSDSRDTSMLQLWQLCAGRKDILDTLGAPSGKSHGSFGFEHSTMFGRWRNCFPLGNGAL